MIKAKKKSYLTSSLGCGKGSSPTSGSVPVKAGDTVEVQWSKSWMHKVGPVKSYLVSFI